MKVAVLGAGAWGTALAILMAAKGLEVYLWARRSDQAEALVLMQENRDYLPGVALPTGLIPVSDAEKALSDCVLAVVAIPAKGLIDTLKPLPRAPAYLSVVKGLIYEHELQRMSQVISELTGVEQVAALSGPNHAEEVARFMPAASTVASAHSDLASLVQTLLSGSSFRVYTSSDLIGVELGGALKNVMALAAGMVDGLRLGDNAKAALITRGLNEVMRFGLLQGAKEKTFYGLSGLGDLVATSTSLHSRNRAAGEALVRGQTLAGLEAQKQVVEGIHTVKALADWAKISQVDLPITQAVYRIIYEAQDPKKMLTGLMEREAKPE